MTAGGAGRQPRGFWIGLALGLPLMAVGLVGAFDNAARTHPAELGRGVVARRVTPAAAWPAVRWALATSGVVALVAWPFVRGYGRRPANPSLLPRDYALGTWVALAAVWVVAAIWASVAWRRSSRDAGGL
jgi:hypothetical protein